MIAPWHHVLQTASYYPIGRIKRPKGDKGTVVVFFTYSINSTSLKEIQALFVEIHHTKVPFLVEEIRYTHPEGIVKFHLINDSNEAQNLCNLPIFIPKFLQKIIIIPPIVHQGKNLIGYHVYDQEKKLLGPIKAIDTRVQQNLLILDYQSKDLLIPYNEKIITEINPTIRTLIVHLPEGFLKAVL